MIPVPSLNMNSLLGSTVAPANTDIEPSTATTDTDENAAERAAVKMWQDKIKADKRKWEPDFKRMRQNMKFAKGVQWPGQVNIDTDKYVANLTLRFVNNKVDELYARNPKAVAIPRKRMLYQVWDEKVESISQAITAAETTSNPQGPTGGQVDVGAMAMVIDYNQGQRLEKITKKICDSLETIYQYQIDAQKPEFKEQMKQLVRRVVICSVGYLKINFIREGTDEGSIPVNHVPSTMMDRAKRAKLILDGIEKGDIQADDARVETLKSLFASMGANARYQDEEMLQERLEFDFPPATAIIPSSKCRNLKEFVAADYITHEHLLAVDEVNAFYDVRIEVGGGEEKAKEYSEGGTEYQKRDTPDYVQQKFVCVWEVYNRLDKSTFVVVEGWPTFVVPPAPVDPCVAGFWTIFALTFNDVETDGNYEDVGTIYPPSDVELIRHPQKEWNRTRDALRAQRNANAPKYPVRAGLMTDEDKVLWESCEPNSIIELQGIPPDAKANDFVMPAQVAKIDQAVYDTRPLEQDIQLAGGMQQANMGPAQPDVTATVGTIAEQSRQVQTTSNVDDLDGFLSRAASAAGEMMLRAFSPDTVKLIAGPGAIWPDITRGDFITTVALTVKAGSSGRPNQALKVNNWKILGPILQQAGANPQALIRHSVEILDDDINPVDFFPVPLPPPQAPQKPVTESLNYKDAPDDIRRQIEAKAGLQPSQDGKMSEGQAGDPKQRAVKTAKSKKPSAASENPS